MNKLIKILTCLLTAVALFSCADDDPIPMTWEFSNYDSEAVTVENSTAYQTFITAKMNYAGEITLKCTNCSVVSFPTDESIGTNAGFKVAKIDDATFKITFYPIELDEGESRGEFVSIDGINGEDKYFSTILISRHNQ